MLAVVLCLTLAAPADRPVILTAELSQPSARPGFGLRITYRWLAVPLERDGEVFVHIRGPEGAFFQHDHGAPTPTTEWRGSIEYTRTLVVPVDAPLGEYTVNAGLWHRASGERIELTAGDGVVDRGDRSYRVATFTLTADAPIPPLPEPSIDPERWRLTFDESFDGPLDVSAWGPGTRWIAHTPYAGDFGDARFGDPGPNSPFELVDGILRITATRVDGRWQAGLLCSVDREGNGFAQRYGYFECRAKFPPGPGTWPAFWLLGQPKLRDRNVDQIEIDVVEQYGVNPNALHTTVHRWNADGSHSAEGTPHLVEGMTTGFHTYGVLVGEEEIIFYYDRRELWRQPTPEVARVPLYLLVNLAVGGGWPIDELPDPSVMEVDYVRVWEVTR